MKKILVVGATSKIAEQCIRIWAKEPCELILLARSFEKLSAIKEDLSVRSPKSLISIHTINFNNQEDVNSFLDQSFEKSHIDIALIAHGSLPDQQQAQNDLDVAKNEFFVNGISPALFAGAIYQRMEKNNCGSLAVIGSVAGDRGRRSNYIYGASKSLVATYIEGLQHRAAATNISISLIKPGPTDTPMTSHLKAEGMELASSEAVAEDIVKGIAKHKPVIYTPIKWQLIMLIIRHLPRMIFNRLNI